jgi:hypothetical protein
LFALLLFALLFLPVTSTSAQSSDGSEPGVSRETREALQLPAPRSSEPTEDSAASDRAEPNDPEGELSTGPAFQGIDAIIDRAESYLRAESSLKESADAEEAAQAAEEAGANEDGPVAESGEAVGRSRREVIRLVGDVLMTANRSEEALRWFRRGAAMSEGESLAEFELSRARALIQLGRSGEARSAARAARDASPSQEMRIRAITVMAEAYAAEGRAREAQDILRGIEVVAGDGALSARTLFQLHAVATALGEESTISRVEKLLQETYPDSPEAALLSRRPDDRVVQALSPTAVVQGMFRGSATASDTAGASSTAGAGAQPEADARQSEAAGAEATTEARPATPAETSEQEVETELDTFVQVGSFTDPENADYMRQDMEDLGFSAELATRDLGAQRYYQVLIPVTADAGESMQEAVQNVVVQLKERGYEGFLVRR